MSGPADVKRVSKPWGYEIIWAHTDRYVGKILHINAGHALSVQYHERKDETVYLLRGELSYRVKVGEEMTDVRLKARRRVPDHAEHDPLHGSDHRLRRARGEHPRSRRRRCGSLHRPLRDARGDERGCVKVIIPLAGKGTRLRPHTHTTPKPMLRVAGKPVMEYILDDLESSAASKQIVYITGHLKETVEKYVREARASPASFVEQVVQNGTASAVELARSRSWTSRC